MSFLAEALQPGMETATQNMQQAQGISAETSSDGNKGSRFAKAEWERSNSAKERDHDMGMDNTKKPSAAADKEIEPFAGQSERPFLEQWKATDVKRPPRDVGREFLAIFDDGSEGASTSRLSVHTRTPPESRQGHRTREVDVLPIENMSTSTFSKQSLNLFESNHGGPSRSKSTQDRRRLLPMSDVRGMSQGMSESTTCLWPSFPISVGKPSCADSLLLHRQNERSSLHSADLDSSQRREYGVPGAHDAPESIRPMTTEHRWGSRGQKLARNKRISNVVRSKSTPPVIPEYIRQKMEAGNFALQHFVDETTSVEHTELLLQNKDTPEERPRSPEEETLMQSMYKYNSEGPDSPGTPLYSFVSIQESKGGPQNSLQLEDDVTNELEITVRSHEMAEKRPGSAGHIENGYQRYGRGARWGAISPLIHEKARPATSAGHGSCGLDLLEKVSDSWFFCLRGFAI